MTCGDAIRRSSHPDTQKKSFGQIIVRHMCRRRAVEAEAIAFLAAPGA